MKNFSMKRFTASLLFIVMIVAALPASLFNFTISAAAAGSETIYVLAGGDFQAGDNGQVDHYYSRINMGNILDKIKENYSTMNGFIFVGDYDGDTHNDSNANAGVAAMMEEVSERFNTLNHDNSYLIEGNHETGAVSGIDATGGYDCDGYAVYLINETDFCERQEGKSAQIQTVADNLKTWLNNKIGEGYEAPIFVATHTPLGYTTRTYTNGDSLYGKYVFDVLNDAAANGLNIIFMHGHDHAYGADNYLGGEAIYLPVGDKINICVPGDKTKWTEETLNFTYMNAGYVGYYNENYYDVTSYEEEKLTMTVFKIENNQVTVERWSKDGLYNLKSAGREGFYANASTCSKIGLSYNTDVYASPQTIALTTTSGGSSSGGTESGTIGDYVNGGVTDNVTTSGGKWVTITEATNGTEASNPTYQYVLDTNGIDAGSDNMYIIVAEDQALALHTSGSSAATAVSVDISGTTLTTDTRDYEYYWDSTYGFTRGSYGLNQSDYNIYLGELANSYLNGIINNDDGTYCLYDTVGTRRTLYYNGSKFTVSEQSNYTNVSVRLYKYSQTIPGTEATPGSNGLYGYLEGDLTYTVASGTSANDALAAVKDGIAIKYTTYEDYSNVGEYADDGDGMTWVLDETYGDGTTPGVYAVTISYNGTVLGTAEVVVPSDKYYIAEGADLYTVEMDFSADDALAAVKEGITVYEAADAEGTGKTPIDDSQVTWNWVDTYDGKNVGPYTVEILYNGVSLGTVDVKVNVQYDTGIADGWTFIETTEGGYKYVLDTDGIDYNTSNNSSNHRYIIVAADQAVALSATPTSTVDVVINGDTIVMSSRANEYHFYNRTNNSGLGIYICNGNGQYLYHGNYVFSLNNNRSGRAWTSFTHNGNGLYTLLGQDNNGAWKMYYSSSNKDFRVQTSSSNVRLYKYEGEAEAADVYAKIEGNTVYYVNQGKSATAALNTVKAGITGYISNNADGSDATELADSKLTWKWLNTFNGNVTGSYFVEISYNGQVLGTVEVIVEPGVINNYPEYPDEGAVKVNKTATGIDFQSSGVAQVELSASGVPMKKGADVIVMLDTSSSMNTYNVTGSTKTRLTVLEESMEELVKQFQTPGDDGELMDIRVAVADFNGFNGYGGSSGTPYDRDETDRLSDKVSYTANGNQAQIYTGSYELNADAFIDAANLKANWVGSLTYASGTNYDYAMDAIYQLGTAIKAENELNNEERDLYVIFMSDGAAMQWNYYHSNGASSYWQYWITGAWSTDEIADQLDCTEHYYYYAADVDGDGYVNEHRMADAIKGSPDETYEVIRKTSDLGTAVSGYENLYNVPGLGATMFAIAFDPTTDQNTPPEAMTESIKTIASDQTGTTKYYYEATSAEQLSSAFSSIGSEIAYAAYNARFVDQMGGGFNLQLATVTYDVADGTTKTITPTIEILSYDIYTRQDYLNGTITEDKIGDRKGTSTVIEIVTFSDDGTEAYSNLNSTGPNGETITAGSNILIGGVIYANTFWYNTNANGVTISGVDIPTDTKTDGTTIGSTNVLPAETFYWKMGTIQTSELAMRYYVYLDGSMEGTKEAGSYATNEYAILYYDNYIGNPCLMETTSPTTAWQSANVSYAFYLVDENGNIIVNQTTGQTGSFANKIAITNPVVYKEILLNNIENVAALQVAALGENVLPTYYEIYDGDAAYTVNIRSNGAGDWKITQGSGKIASTYVTQYKIDDPSAYSNALTNDSIGDDYTHTVVWFAVVWKVQAHPDSVVIDYGLPVDISVLTNDMFGENGKLAGVGAYTDGIENTTAGTTLAFGFGATYTGTYGVAIADTTTGKVRYTLNTMSMDGYEKFAYAVNYTGTTNPGYYYDTVTVIPATSIYYEETFVTFTPANKAADGIGVWTDDGDYNDDATQEEDRPGKYSLADHNNLYGYDGINSSATTYSLGAAKKVTVNSAIGYHKDNSPYATFTFTGTGFDIISMTNSDSGAIFVNVKGTSTDGTISTDETYFVDNYYEYAYDETNGWHVLADGETSDTNAIYQVPVMKFSELPHGTYSATIWVVYNSYFDHDSTVGYSFWLDSIRIYDPAGDGIDGEDTTINDAYIADGEAYPHYLQVKDAILAAADVESDALANNGVVFIDGMQSTSSVADYTNPGPNNEAYLAPGQSISFKLTANTKPVDVQLGAKLAYGSTAYIELTYTVNDESTGKTQEFKTATDMYYTIMQYLSDADKDSTNGWTTGTITITNVSDQHGITDAIVSLTNIKATFTSDEVISGGTAEVSATASTGTFSLMSARTANLTTTETETAEAVEIAFLVDAEVIEDACAVMTELYAPKPEPTPEPEVFVPEVLEYTVTSGLFGYNNVIVITSKDVASLTVNGIEAQKLSSSRLFSTMLKLIVDFEEKLGINFSVDEYDIWAVYTKRADSYEIVAVNDAGLSTDPTVTDSNTSITKDDIAGFIDRSEIFKIMEELAEQYFNPEYFETYINERIDGVREIITQTSEDVEYIVIDGKIVDRYITETVIDTETGEKTTKRVWITDAGEETEDEEPTVNVYDEKGVASESRRAERKFGFNFGSKNTESTDSAFENNGKSESSKNNGKNNNKFNSGKNGRM